MGIQDQIDQRVDRLTKHAKDCHAQAHKASTQANVLRAWAAMLKLGLKIGDRFRIVGNHYGQTDAEGILTGHDNGNLIGSIIDKSRKRVTGNDFVFYAFRLNDIVALGPDPLGERFVCDFDPSDLLNNEEDNVGHL